MIIDRHITKELGLNFLAITCILLFVALSNRFVHLLAKVAIGQLPSNLVFQVVALYIPELLAALAPLGLFVAILFSLGRLHADSEMVVLFTSGLNWQYLSKVVLKFALVVAVIVLFFTTWLIPNIVQYREDVISNGEAIGIMQAIVPGQFQVLDGGALVFYVEDITKKPTTKLAKIFIAEQPDNRATDQQATVVITADHGFLQHKTINNVQDFFLVLKNGRRYTGRPGDLNYTVVTFAEYGRAVENTPSDPITKQEEFTSTLRLLKSKKLANIAELQWRFSLPISVLILALLAIPLAKVSPRQGRFAKFLPAILLYIAYFNLILVAKRWVAAGTISPYYGIWLVHFSFFALGGIFLAHASGRLSQLFNSSKGPQ